MIPLAITLGVLLLIGFIPLGVIVRLENGRLVVRARAAFIRVTVVGGQPKKPRSEKKREIKKKPPAEPKTAEKQPSFFKKYITGLDDAKALAALLMRTLGRCIRGLRVNKLRLTVIAASDEAPKTVWMFTALNAVTGMVYPWLKSHVRIRNDRIRYIPGFDRVKPDITLYLSVSVTVGRLLAIALATLAAFIGFIRRPRGAAEPPLRDTGMASAAQ